MELSPLKRAKYAPLVWDGTVDAENDAQPRDNRQTVESQASSSHMEQYGEPSTVTVVSVLDICAIVVSLAALALAILVIYQKSIAIEFGFKNQLVVFGILLQIQGFCTSRQVLLCAIFCQVRYGRATLQNLDSLLRKSIFTKDASWSLRVLLLALAGLPPFLGALYKLPAIGSTSHEIPSRTGQFGIVPPPNLDNLNGNGIALAVSRMTPFWQNRPRHAVKNITYGENMLAVDENVTAMLDTPMISTYDGPRARLSANPSRNQSLHLWADVNATVSTKVEIPAEELSSFAEIFDDLKCESSDSFWCAGIGDGWWTGMVFGGVKPSKFAPAASPTVNYLGIWQGPSEKFSDVTQKFILSRQRAHGIWRINSSSTTLESAYTINNGSQAPSQDPVSTKPLSLDLFGQLLQEYNYRWYDFDFAKSVNYFMASITWARLATLTIEDRSNKNPWYSSVNYTKPAEEYGLQLEAATVSPSILLVLVFVVHPLLVITATVVKACLHKTPVSDGVGIISLLSGASKDSLSMLGGAGYSGALNRIVRVRFSVDAGAVSGHVCERVTMHLKDSDGPETPRIDQSDSVQANYSYR